MYKGFTAAHLGSIVATLWVLLLNGLVGFQILDDGTPMSLGLVLGSAIAFFVGTGYIALDTAFSYTNTFVSSLTGNNHNIALYVLYQLWPLICLFGFFVLETILVLRVLGERKPMGQYLLSITFVRELTLHSLPRRCHITVCSRANIPICCQHTYLQWHQRQDRWCFLRDSTHPTLCYHDLRLLVKHHRRRLAVSCWRESIQRARLQMTSGIDHLARSNTGFDD